VFFTKITPLPERFQMASRRHVWKNPGLGLSGDGLKLALVPESDDIVIPKNTTSIFIGTNFELMVRNAGLDTIVFTGIATEIGVESSARDALNRGFFTVVAREAVSSMNKEKHERSLANLENMVLVRSNAEIRDMWDRPSE
jgi:nicotinamidase-related amidase